MGCTSSSLSFRDVYIDLQQRWGLDPKLYGVLEPNGVSERSSVFASRASDAARQASQEFLLRDGRLFTCDSLLVEQASLLKYFLFPSEGKDTPHPYNAVLFRRLLSVVSAEHARHAATEVFSIIREGSFISRWDYRVWMVACCEFYHVLAVLQEQKALPKSTKAFMKALARLSEQSALLQQNTEGTVLFQDTLEEVWREGSAVQLTSSMLEGLAMEQLRSQMPSVLAYTPKSTSTSTATSSDDSLAPRLIALATEYEKRVVPMTERQSSNPLCSCDIASVRSSVSLLVFAEWAAMECALSFCGPEEDFASYGVAPVPLSSVLLQPKNSLRQQWRTRLLHLSEVKCELAELEPLGHLSEAYGQLLAKKEALEREMEKQVERWRGNCEALSAEDVEGMCWGLLEVRESLPNRTVHQILSRKAFEHTSRVGGTISTTSQLCNYLRHYLALHDLYCDVLIHQLKRSDLEGLDDESCLPRPTDFDTFRIVLVAAQARHDTCLDPLLGSAAGCGPLRAALTLDVMRHLFNSVAENDMEDGVRGVSFDALCAMVVRGFAQGRHVSLSLRSIDELRSAVGIDKTKRRHAFIESFLREAFTLNQEGLSACGPLLAAKALEAVVGLPQYTDHSACVAAMVVRYASLEPRCWCALSASDEVELAAVTRWLYRLRSESLDRLSLMENSTCMEFAVRTLFCVAAAQRGFEDTAPRAEKSVNSDISFGDVQLSATRPLMTTGVTQAHFVRAMAAICKYLECPADVLLNNSNALLLPTSSATDVLATLTMSPQFTVESAFRSFQGVPHSAVDCHGCDDGEVEQRNAPDRTPTARVRQILFVIVFNYTRQHCFMDWKTHTQYADGSVTSSAAEDGSSGDYPKWEGESTLLALSHAMPLQTLVGCYRVFAQLTEREAQRNGPAESARGRQSLFLHALYTRYMLFFQQLHLDEDHVAEVGARALQFIVSQSGCGTCDHGELGITRRGFSSFLQFILGYLMTEKAYESAVEANMGVRGVAQDGTVEVFLSEQDCLNLLACFGRLTKGGISAIPTLEEAQLWLRSHCFENTYKGFISLQNMCLWYGSYRAEHYALESLYDWWRESYAQRIPFTASTEHRCERQSTMREILRLKQHREHLSESYPVEASEDEDGFLPVEIASAVLERHWGVREVTTRVFGMDEESTAGATPPGDRGEAQASSSSSSVPLWLDSCECGSNAALHRTDPGSRKVHRSDFRFFLQYMHHFVSAYISLYYALAVLEASSGAVSSDGSVHRVPSTPAEHQEKMTELLSQSLLPLLPLIAMPAEMSSTLSIVVTDMWHDMQTTGIVPDVTCRRGAHSIAAFLVSHSHLLSYRVRQSYLEGIEAQDIHEMLNTQGALLGEMGSYDTSAKLSYWECLRVLLPFGPSLHQRQRRRELFMWMDHRQRGYLTMSDIARGLMDRVQLQSFRADFSAALLRAFRATKDVAAERQNVIYLTQHTEEQVLMPWEFNAFLAYLYRYLELYFMFDVLTCGGHVHPETLHVVQKQQRYDTADPDEGRSGGESVGASRNERADGAEDAAVAADGVAVALHTRSAAVDLYEASTRPYQITLEAGLMKKEVSLAQFRIARQLLRQWGAHVENPVEVFEHVDRRCHEEGKMLFNGFAIWASEHDLHPAANDYGYVDSVDAIAIMEEDCASR
ncbi:hypothetical protein, conserved [Leishmania lindenbergi]|uniref:Flagellar calcium-binding protein EF-hand domain-containing protein n=1 Tax=Leishmania lindenbergi TaxID=651832 RepID=A0AAW3ANU1_9TRYP